MGRFVFPTRNKANQAVRQRTPVRVPRGANHQPVFRYATINLTVDIALLRDWESLNPTRSWREFLASKLWWLADAESDLPFLEVTSVSDLSEFDESQVEKIAVRPQATHVTFIVEKLPPSMEKSLTDKMLDGWKRQNGTGKHR